MTDRAAPQPKPEVAGAAWLRAVLLLVWAGLSFGVMFFARDLEQTVGDWPLIYWLAAQGGVLVFMAIVAAYAWFMNRHPADEAAVPDDDDDEVAHDARG